MIYRVIASFIPVIHLINHNNHNNNILTVPVGGSVNGMTQKKTNFFFLLCSCLIPECETLETATFEPDWLQNAVPFQNKKPLHCKRYAFNSTDHGSLWRSECTKNDFDTSNIIRCNTFKYRTDELSVLNEVSSPFGSVDSRRT